MLLIQECPSSALPLPVVGWDRGEGYQRSFFLPSKVHDLIIGSPEHSGIFGVNDVEVQALEKYANGGRHVFIEQELRHQADLSKGTYSASRIRPAA